MTITLAMRTRSVVAGRRIGSAFLLWLAFSLAPNPSHACSCVEMKRTSKQIQKMMSNHWKSSDNVVLVRTLEETHTADWDRQRATLIVEKVWKGRYKVGDKIQTDTQSI